MTLYKWLQTSGSNANSDPTINWAEGQAPSTVNDSARAMMASVAKWRDDIAGAIVTAGAVNAYTVTSNQIFDTLAHLNGQIIAFTPHVTNTSAAVLSVDGLGGKPLRTSPNVELQSGVLIQGTPYVAIYNNSDGAFYLRGIGPAPGIPLGAGMDYWGSTTPSTFFAFPTGQAISRTTYATLFSLLGTTFGTGDGSTTFNLPDKSGRVSAMKEASATRLTTIGSGIDGGTFGASGGAQNQMLASSQIPSLTLTGSNSISVSGSAIKDNTTAFIAAAIGSSPIAGWSSPVTASTISSTGSNNISVTYTNGSQVVVKTAMPTIICNYVMRII